MKGGWLGCRGQWCQKRQTDQGGKDMTTSSSSGRRSASADGRCQRSHSWLLYACQIARFKETELAQLRVLERDRCRQEIDKSRREVCVVELLLTTQHIQCLLCWFLNVSMLKQMSWVFLYSFLLQYFDTVGWVFWPVKTVSHITYTVLAGT